MTEHSIWEHHLRRYGLEDIPDPSRQMLPADSAVVIIHSDIHPSNIMVSEEPLCSIVALVDWH
jgi:aminoglycoside phosphotransferase (APT) family kinase protein